MKKQEFEKLAHKNYGFGRPSDCLDFSHSCYDLNETCMKEWGKGKLSYCSKLKGLECKYLEERKNKKVNSLN